jgi:RNA polymerase sigma factor (sigma-70 family)
MMNEMKSFWTKKYNQNIAKMIGVCYRYVPVRETAEDIAHDAFLTAIEKVDTFRGTGPFEAWLMRITVNKALAYLNEQRKSVPLEMEVKVDVADTDEDDEETSVDEMMAAIRKANFSQEEIMEAIAQLNEKHRTVLNLYVFERYKHPQIAKLLGITVNTSKSHLLRARRHLQEILFEKSKRKKHLLMFMFPLFNNTNKAFDDYCRRQMKGFSLPPQQPLNLAGVPSPSLPSLRVWLQAHTLPVVATGVTTAAAGCIIWATHTRPAIPATSPAETPKAIPAAVMDTTTAVDEEIFNTAIPEPETAPAPVTAPQTVSRPAPVNMEANTPPTSTDTTVSDARAENPVVVKKVRRKSKQTIIVKDQN